MKNLLAPLLAMFGITGAASGAVKPAVTTIDSKSLHYTMPTVASDPLEFVVPTQDSFTGAPQFHEDEWSQVEFFPKARLPEMQQLLSAYKVFEQSHRSSAGWSDIYARRLKRDVVIPGDNAVARIAESFGSTPGNSPILHITSSPLGQVQNGFTVPLASDVFLYGITNEGGITSLAAMLFSGADDALLTQAFSKLNATDGLILVDWLGQQILVSSSADGSIELWRP